MVSDILIVLIILLLPRCMVLLSDRFRAFGLLGPVFLCYAAGFLLSFLFTDTGMAMTLSEVCVPLAIPLILFSSDFSSLKKLARPVLLSFLLMCLAAMASASVGYFLFRDSVAEARSISGMLVGLYTGGTPNLMAIGMALGLEQSYILLANTADLIVGGFYFFLLLSVMPKIARAFLPTYRSGTAEIGDRELEQRLDAQFVPEKEVFSWKSLLRRLPIFLLAVAALGISLGASWLITGKIGDVMIVMLGVTTLGAAFSFIPRVRRTPGAYTAGQYLILMFSVAMGLSFDLSVISKESLMLLFMLLFVQFFALLLHALLAKIAHIDADVALITSTAGIYGPAFIPSVANALKNSEIVLAGLICGILGYAVGNYLGIGLSMLLGLF